MATEIKLPRLGEGMEAGTIVKWLKSEGEAVKKGEPLYELDTDKVTQEVEADASGVLLKIAVAEGEVPVGRTIAVIGEAGEEVPVESPEEDMKKAADEEADQSGEKPARAPAREQERERGREASTNGSDGGAPQQQQPQEASQTGGGRGKASPPARRIARRRGIELASLSGTGPEGRIVAEDVERAAATGGTAAPQAAPTVSGEVESRPLTRIRKTIARRLTEAWTVPVFQLTVSVDMTRANALLERAGDLGGSVRLTVTDLITRVCGSALTRHPDVNVQFTEEALLRFPSADVGLAVATPQGLVVPVIRSVERLSLAEVAARRADVVERARSGSLQLADLEGGTFTISNLGMFGVEQFSAVLNPPQAAILAVGATTHPPVARGGGGVVPPVM